MSSDQGARVLVTRECAAHGPVPDALRVELEGPLTEHELATRPCPIPCYDEEPCGERLGEPVRWQRAVPDEERAS